MSIENFEEIKSALILVEQIKEKSTELNKLIEKMDVEETKLIGGIIIGIYSPMGGNHLHVAGTNVVLEGLKDIIVRKISE